MSCHIILIYNRLIYYNKFHEFLIQVIISTQLILKYTLLFVYACYHMPKCTFNININFIEILGYEDVYFQTTTD